MRQRFLLLKQKTHWFITNLFSKNSFYYLQSLFRRSLGIKPANFEIKKLRCPDCVDNGYCLVCGCHTINMFYSDKPCPKSDYTNEIYNEQSKL